MFSYTMDGNLLEVSEEKDLVWCNYWQRLGISFTYSISCQQSLGLLKHCFINLSSTTFSNLYKTLIRLVLEYDNTIWDPFYTTNIDNLENIQRKAIKLIPILFII